MDTAGPRKIYVELTTRCNLHCRMCVKQSEGGGIGDEDLPLAAFKRLGSALPRAEALILNGIGEPLLHPQLEEAVRFAREMMGAEALIGFQSNGVLLGSKRCRDLLSAGLSTVCLSLDCLDEKAGSSDGEHNMGAVSRALAALLAAKRQTGRNSFRTGLEMVLTRTTFHELPRYIHWAAEHGVDYVIVTHLFHYTPATERLSLFNPNSSEAVALFDRYRQRAERQGLDLRDYPAVFMKYSKSERERATVELFREMQEEARTGDIVLHLQSLMRHARPEAASLERVFAAARTAAERCGVELFLPANQALDRRSCPFIADEAVFIAASGEVMPCRFLWHTFACRVLGESIQVHSRPLGNIRREPLENIWRRPENSAFRREAGDYGYSRCWSCTQGPCADLVNENIHLAHDCYGSGVPCGHCQWNLGGTRCL